MKHLFLKSVTALFLSLVVLATSCKKGDTGPAGPKGDTGPTGATGATGATGKTGTANVIYSAWLNVTFAAVNDSVGGAQIDAPKLVDSIIEKGDVKVFWNVNSASNPYIVALPYADNGLVLGVNDLHLNFVATVGAILLYSNYNLSSGTSNGEAVGQYRYILIPGGSAARSAVVNWNDYNQVKNYLGLKN